MSRNPALTVARHPDWPGLEAVAAQGVATAIVRHVHARLVVGLCLSGKRRLASGAGDLSAGPGELFVIPAGLPHACLPEAGAGQAYLALAVDTGLLPQPSRAVPSGAAGLRVQADPEAAAQLTRLVAIVAGGGRPAPELLAALARRLDLRPTAAPPPHPATRRVRAIIDAAPERAASLAALARSVAVSPYHLERLFCRDVGVPLGEYVLARRVGLAMARLRAGEGLAEAALAAGFCDQSHFSRHFRRRMGLPPGRCRIG